MDEESSDSFSSSEDEEKGPKATYMFKEESEEEEEDDFSVFKKRTSTENTENRPVKLIAMPKKIIKTSKIVLSEETKNKLEEELKKQESVSDNTSATVKTEEASKTNIDEDKKEAKPVEDKKETKPVEDKKEIKSLEDKKEIKSLEDKKETKPVKDEDDDDDEEEEEESEDEDAPKKKKAKTAPEASQYDPKNVHYEGDLAIYTDPKSGYQYKWCNDTNQWLSKGDVTYGFEDDVHTYTDSEGVKYFWDVDKNAWFPKIDDDFMARYQMNYGFVDNTTKDDEKKEEEKKDEDKPEVKPPEPKDEKEKGVKKPVEIVPPSWFEMSDQQNTKVYVGNLPTDITEEEFVDLMQKCGLVMRDMQSGKMKVKLYTVPETDILKGDGLCTYIKIESVELALNLLDGYVYRGKKITVERAKFEMKGAYNPNLKPKKRKRKDKDKLKKMQEKLFDWRPEKMRGERSKHERVVIVKNLFEPTLFDEDASLILEYQQDLREECGKCGEVKRVVLYDRHPEGVAQITMKAPEEADEAVTLLNGRWFGQRKLTAEIWDGKTKYKIGETDAQISQRLDNWDKFLELDEATKPSEKQSSETEKSEKQTEDTEKSKKQTSETEKSEK